MSTIKKFLNLIFIDGLSGMALGLFSTLIIGTILKQAADLIGGDFGYYLGVFAVMAQRLTGAGIGIGVAYKYKSSTYVTLSAAAAGMIGAYATAIISGSILSDGALVYSSCRRSSVSFHCCSCRHCCWFSPCRQNQTGLIDHPCCHHYRGRCSGHYRRFRLCQRS